jgi:hypothetical protein
MFMKSAFIQSGHSTHPNIHYIFYCYTVMADIAYCLSHLFLVHSLVLFRK